MPKDVDVRQLRKLLEDERTQLIEVLPPDEYEEEHLPRAINIPLKSLNREAVASLDPSSPTVVYCWDDI